MKRKIVYFLLGIIPLVLLIRLLITVFAEPWVGEKIQTALNEKNGEYRVEIDKVHILLITSGIELDNITICSMQEHGIKRNINGKIASIKFKGINLIKLLFKHDIIIHKVTISNSSIRGMIPFYRKATKPVVLTMNIRIGQFFFKNIDLELENPSTAKSFSMKEGFLKVYDLQVEKQDTLSPGLLKRFDFEAKKLVSVSPDSMYSFTTSNISYSTTSNTLAAKSFSVKPNYTVSEFSSKYEFQTDCIEADLRDIYVHNFHAASYFRFGSLISSYIEIRKMDIKDFLDLRKEFRHEKKPAFQDMIYNYPGAIQIDSISIINGNFSYTEHAEKANQPGNISFNEIRAKLYKITNDTIYKTESASLEVKGDALLMGKGKMTILLKSKIFDKHNAFSVNGTLSDLEAKDLNPILEKNAFIYAISGKIETMHFNFTANNTKATGKMTLIYHGLDVAVKNKRTDDTTAFKERIISFIANRKLLDSNPVPGENVRVGIIHYERDPERFLFNYCYKSILSGIKSSLTKNPKKSKNK